MRRQDRQEHCFACSCGSLGGAAATAIEFRKKWATNLRRMRSAAFTPLQHAKRKPARYLQHIVVVDGEAG